MDDRLESTVEAMALASAPLGPSEHVRNVARAMLQAALDEGGVVEAIWKEHATGRRKLYSELVVKYNDLHEAAKAVYDVAERDTEIFRRLRRELERG